MPLFPTFLKLAGRRCLVIGAGRVAEDKIESLLLAEADVRVVAPAATERIRAWSRAGKIRLDPRKFRPADLKGVFLAVAATSSPAVHARIFREARRLGVLCNAVDDPAHCDFYYGSVVRRGALQIAISTGGHSPALAQRLRIQFEREFSTNYQYWLEELAAARQKLFKKPISGERRRALLHELASANSFEEFLRRHKRKRK
jgi:precorrin-2 dehydrogenase/sirohydrochlorin ferrochelatase